MDKKKSGDSLDKIFETQHICSWDQAVAEILDKTEISDPNKSACHPYPYIYRGARDADWKPLTNLERGYMKSDFLSKDNRARCRKPICAYEHVQLRNFKKYAYLHTDYASTNYIDEMVIAQHFYQHTRLLDWTVSPLVALFFATKLEDSGSHDKETDGVVWRLHHDNVRCKLPKKLKKVLEHHQGARSFTSEMLCGNTPASSCNNSKPPYPALNDLQECDDNALIVIDPLMLDQRLVNQASVFTLITGSLSRIDDAHSDYRSILRECKQASHMRWAKHKKNRKLVKRYRIRAKAKKEIREMLQLLNITPRVIFPGLEGVARTLEDRYRT